tara:strand:- start:15613 stop:16248 length:636 start_codon:yes stop_codon:yes gene_type:complete
MADKPTIKRLVFKARYLRIELLECQRVYESAKMKFFKRAIEKKNELGAEDDEVSDNTLHEDDHVEQKPVVSDGISSKDADHDDHIDDIEIKSKPAWAKKLFREVATITHPDKIPESISDKLRNKLIETYKHALSSYESGNFSKLIEAADELGIDAEIDDDDIVHFLYQEIDTLECQIVEIRETAIWEWEHADDKRRSEIIEMFAGVRGWTS